METRYCNQRGQLDAEVVPVHNTASKAAYDDAEKGVEKATLCPKVVQSGIQTAWIVTFSRVARLSAHNVLEPTLLWIGSVKMGTPVTSMNHT